jgi:DNA-binding response OmpR family regulator
VETFLVFPDPPSEEVGRALEQAGWPWKAVGRLAAARDLEPPDGWSGAIVDLRPAPEEGFGLCRQLRTREARVRPLLLLLAADQLPLLELRDDLYDDVAVAPFTVAELQTRLAHQLWAAGRGQRSEIVAYGPLVLNIETYQAAVGGRPLDLTYMEYELLRFLASHPGRVFNRETLLSRVWGYEYFGGARTVDVHIRRLRAKLGEEHAHLIQTVRSVGYRLGQGRGWTP